MSISIIQQKAIELDAALADLIISDVNDAISTLRIALQRASETLKLPAYYMKPSLDNLYQEIKDLTNN